jgi:pyruvate dehydrogenase E2 component (dihydrolipoamide acetyltransferase)
MTQLIEVKVPDIGDYKDVPIIEIPVKVGDVIKAEDSLITLESDKATMDVPSPVAGEVVEIKVKVGDRVGEGMLVAVVKVGSGETAIVAAPAATEAAAPAPVRPEPVEGPAAFPPSTSSVQTDSGIPTPMNADYRPGDPELVVPTRPAMPSVSDLAAESMGGHSPHASPSVRHFARDLGVDVIRVKGTGPKGRITQADVTAFVKGVMSGAAPVAAVAAPALGGGLDLLPWPKIDFTKFGEIETKPLSRIKKISGQNLARNWAMIPAVTYHEDADITDLEAFRVAMNKEYEKSGKKLTMLAFIIKAAVRALKEFPEFNTSLDGDNLVYKKYFNIAFAADTPNGLVVPVVKDADQKSVFDIARETGELAKLAREGKIKPADMQGACFTISSVGGIGGTYFAPIVNAPEVAILGVNKSVMKPVWDGSAFIPRLMLPMSLSADHRVIDGALATRFNVYLAQLLGDFRRVML